MLKRLAKFTIWGWVGLNPVKAFATSMMMMGLGLIASGALNPPAVTPQPGAMFPQSNSFGILNAGLIMASGSMQLPATSTGSFVFEHEFGIDQSIGGAAKWAIGSGNQTNRGILFNTTTNGVLSMGLNQTALGFASVAQPWWLATVAYQPISGGNSLTYTPGAASVYSPGFYGWTATDGCETSHGAGAREPSGVVLTKQSTTVANVIAFTDPGFLCSTNSSGAAPTVSVAAMPGIGSQQSTGAGGNTTTCASNTPTANQFTVTAHVAVAQGVSNGQSFALTGMTPSGYNETYAAISPTNGATLVGTYANGTGTCPGAVTVEGSVGTGTGGSIAMGAPGANPYNLHLAGSLGTGIQFKPGQRVCGWVGENGSDSLFPGSQFAKYTGVDGVDLPGSPAISPWLNQNIGVFNGYTIAGAQSAGNPALVVTSMVPYSIVSASYSSGTGLVTFTMSGNTPFQIGSEFTVASMTGGTGSGFNVTYIAVTGTNGPGSTTIVGNPLSGLIGVPQPNNPGASSATGGNMVTVITPGMEIVGATGSAIINPIGAYGSTGAGGAGSYGLTVTQASYTFTARIDNGTIGNAGNTLTTSGMLTGAQQIVVGHSITVPGGSNVVVTALLGATVGGNGTYTVNGSPQNIAAETMTDAGTIGSSGSPVPIYAASGFYYNVAPSGTAAGGGTVTVHTTAAIGDFMNLIGSASSATVTPFSTNNGWGGSVANVGMYNGPVPMTSAGAPDPTAFNQLCGKTKEFVKWASDNGGSWRGLYKLNDGGIYGDHGLGDFTGAVDTAGNLTISSSPLPANFAAGTVVSGAGLCSSVTASVCPTVSSGSGSSYVISPAPAVAVASETMAAGSFQPAVPISSSFLGINATISGSTLTVNDLTAGWTGTAHVLAQASGANALIIDSTNSGALVQGMCLSDVTGAIATQNPLCITGGSGTTFSIQGGTGEFNYYSAGIASENMAGTMVSITPGHFVMGVGVTSPVQVTGYGTLAACTTGPNATWGQFPGCGTYAISNLGSVAVTNAALTMSGIGASGAVAPGSALTIQNPGFGNTYPTTALGSSSGNMQFNGEYDVSLLGGTPAHIQALISSSPSSPATPVVGCSACNWTNVSSEVISGGKWSGTVASIPNGGPYYAFFRASNGTGYANLVNPVWVGWNVGPLGEGNALDQLLNTQNANQTFWAGSSQLVGWQTAGSSSQNQTNAGYVPGPPIQGVYSYSVPNATITDGFSVKGSSLSTVNDGSASLLQGASSIMGGTPVGLDNLTRNGTGFQSMIYDGVTSSQTIGLGDASTKVFSSGLGFGGSLSTSAGAVANTVTGSISSNTMTITAASTGTNNWFYIDRGQQVTCGSCTAGTVITGLGTGTGLSGTYIVSPSQTVSSTTLTITHNNLDFNAAWGYGARITGTYSAGAVGPTLTVNSLTAGAMAPLLTVSDGTNSSTLKACLTGCSLLGTQQAGSTWLLNNTNLSGDTSATAMTVAPSGGALYPAVNPQPGQIPVDTGNGTVGTTALIKYGTLQVLVDGTVVCQDSSTFAYNIQAGNCTGAGVSGWVNYLTGGYAVTFTAAPASNAAIVAKWVNLQSGDSTLSHEQIPWVGDSTATGGVLASVAARTGGINAYLNGQQGTGGWPNNNLNYARALNWVFGTSMAGLHNGQTNQPLLTTGQWRGQGPVAFQGLFSYSGDLDLEQLDQDEVTKSEWSGTIAGTTASAVLTLTSAATGPMWEGEIIECNPYALTCAIPQGAEIVNLCTVATCGADSPQGVGVSGSTYNIVSVNGNFSNIASAIPIHNAMIYPGGGCYVGPFNDLTMQAGAGGAGNYAVETGSGNFGALLYGYRIGIEIGACLNGHPEKGMNPTLSRTTFTGCDASATSSPCGDIADTYAASHAMTWTGATATVTGGISAGARPFVPGQTFKCSGCNSNLVITGLDVPATQSTVTGAGEVGQTFHVTVSGTIGGSGSGTVTAGCGGSTGTNFSCADFALQINTTGTYGTQAQLNTCGVNNFAGTSTNLPTAAGFTFPNGTCVPSGNGALVRGFRIGVTQIMDTPFSNAANPGPGSVYDTGPDPDSEALVVNRSQAYACHIVGKLTSPARGIVQCVHAPLYSGGLFSSLGTWATGAAFASYGDPYAATGFIGAILAPLGGQSFPVTAGSGYPDGHYVTGAVCSAMASPTGANATAIPAMGFDISGGQLVSAYPTILGNGMQSACTFPLSLSGTGTLTLTSGLNGTFKLTAPPTGGTIAPGEVLTIGAQQVTIKNITGAITNTGVSTTQTYQVSCAVTCVTAAGAAFTVGPQSGSGGSIATVPVGWGTGTTAAANSEGQGVIGTFDSDSNLTGILMFDNSAASGNPLAGKFNLPAGGVNSPGLSVRPFGMRRGVVINDSGGSSPAAAGCAPDLFMSMCAGGLQ